jgi:hypothetical protein
MLIYPTIKIYYMSQQTVADIGLVFLSILGLFVFWVLVNCGSGGISDMEKVEDSF